MKTTKVSGVTAQLAIVLAVILLAANIILGTVLTNISRDSMKTLIQNRMLDIAKTSAGMLDGDVLGSLKKEDKGTPGYQQINDTLAVFQDNIDLKYIYCIYDSGDENFVFSVDPTIEDPGEFGTPVVWTEALSEANKGLASVDDEPYTDDWGKFYSAYAPVFDSEGKVAGIVAVDFAAEWYDAQIARQTRAIFIGTVFTVLLGLALLMVATDNLRKKLREMTDDMTELAKDVEELTLEINPEAVPKYNDEIQSGDVVDIGERLSVIRDELANYIANVHSRANSMITALSSDYRSVYYIDLDKNEGICYQSHTHIDNGLKQGEHFTFEETVKKYAEDFVTDEYKEDFLDFIEADNVRKALETERIITFRYKINRNGKDSYEMIRMAGVRHPEDRDDGIVHAIGMGFTDVDAETRKALAQGQALKDALEAARGANRAKTAFLSSMSHEIRTPMNAIIGIDRLALEKTDLPDDTRESLEKIGHAANHLLGIINDILDMSRIEAGRMVLRAEPFSINTLLEQVDVMISGQCSEKGLNWIHDYESDGDEVYIGDELKLKQVLINILGNSVKFTPEGGTVRLAVEKNAKYESKTVFAFTISDTGIGMSKDFIPKLFEPFSQEDLTTKTKYGSTGLGMSITASIVEMMNGTIEVESEKGKGSTFVVTVTLEISKEAIPGEKAAIDSDEAEQIPKKEVNLQGKRFLLAEDVDINAEIIKMMLQSKEIEVVRAENGRVAVDIFTESKPKDFDLILMDMRMPEMDGLEATKAIRSLDREDAKTIPIIALTANAFDEDVKRSLQAGLNAHLSKPIEPDVLFSTLEKELSVV